MATNGIISIMKDGRVMFKCVAGCDGYNAEKTAKAIKEGGQYDLGTIYNTCIENNFGCKSGCLIVQGKNDFMGVDKEEGLPELYEEKFTEPRFNPRWERGSAAYIEIIEIASK